MGANKIYFSASPLDPANFGSKSHVIRFPFNLERVIRFILKIASHASKMVVSCEKDTRYGKN